MTYLIYPKFNEKKNNSMKTTIYIINTKLARGLQCIWHAANYGSTVTQA